MIQCAMLDWWWVFELVDIKMYTAACPPVSFPCARPVHKNMSAWHVSLQQWLA